MKAKINVARNEYSEYLEGEFNRLETEKTRWNSIYEFRILQGFD